MGPLVPTWHTGTLNNSTSLSSLMFEPEYVGTTPPQKRWGELGADFLGWLLDVISAV